MDWLWVLIIAIRGVSPEPDDQWATRLHELDQLRAAAFATADPTQLSGVYVEDSDGERKDTTTIEAYARRDGRVTGAELRVLSCRVVRETAEQVQLDVVDQLGPAHVEWGNGSSTALPHDEPTRRLLTLIRTAEGWRIAASDEITTPR